jgi:hypothetical protein
MAENAPIPAEREAEAVRALPERWRTTALSLAASVALRHRLKADALNYAADELDAALRSHAAALRQPVQRTPASGDDAALIAEARELCDSYAQNAPQYRCYDSGEMEYANRCARLIERADALCNALAARSAENARLREQVASIGGGDVEGKRLEEAVAHAVGRDAAKCALAALRAALREPAAEQKG